MNRALLKQDAKDAMKAANPHPVLTTLVFWAIQLAAQIILGIVSSICGFTTYFAAAISSGMYEDSAFLNYAPSIGAFLIYLVVAIVIGLLIGTVQFGYYAYSLKVFKHEEAGISELLAYFPMLLKIFGLSLWMSLFIMLWSCLCYIPGIIAALRYSQAFYILAEDPNKGIRQCVNESKELMSGHLWEYFVLQLSFILWYLLSIKQKLCPIADRGFKYYINQACLVVCHYIHRIVRITFDRIERIENEYGNRRTDNI